MSRTTPVIGDNDLHDFMLMHATANTHSQLLLLLIILPVLPVFRPSVVLLFPVLVVFRTSVPQYSQYSQYERYSILVLYWASEYTYGFCSAMLQLLLECAWHTCPNGTRPKRQDVAYTVMLLLMIIYGHAAVPQLLLWRVCLSLASIDQWNTFATMSIDTWC